MQSKTFSSAFSRIFANFSKIVGQEFVKLREAEKVFLSGPATKRGGEVKAGPLEARDIKTALDTIPAAISDF